MQVGEDCEAKMGADKMDVAQYTSGTCEKKVQLFVCNARKAIAFDPGRRTVPRGPLCAQVRGDAVHRGALASYSKN